MYFTFVEFGNSQWKKIMIKTDAENQKISFMLLSMTNAATTLPMMQTHSIVLKVSTVESGV